jgi:hypothetical protein
MRLIIAQRGLAARFPAELWWRAAADGNDAASQAGRRIDHPGEL